MKIRVLYPFVVALALLSVPSLARAQGDTGGNLGIGLIVGNPTGLSLRYYYEGTKSIDAALGATFAGRSGLHLHVDHLWMLSVLTREPGFDLGLYGGIGGRLLQHDRKDYEDHVHIGVRGPLGLVFDFGPGGVPMDAFVEVALILDIITGDQRGENRLGLDVNAAIGARFYF